MHVGLSHDAFTIQRGGGISRYVFELARQLTRAQPVQLKLVCPLYDNNYLLDLPKSEISLVGMRLPRIPWGRRIKELANPVLSRIFLPPFLDVYHQTYYSNAPFPLASAAKVVTVYDMIHELFPEMYGSTDETTSWKKKAVQEADHIICISENTRRDLIQILGVPPSKTSVVYLGVREADGVACSSPSTERPFLLFVGERGRYKNFERLLCAFARSDLARSGVLLACFGGGSLSLHEEQLIFSLGIRHLVRHLSGDDIALAAAYRSAVALVYPSLYEGFGLPILEAMALGCPVLCSNTSSLPEVTGQAAILFDPSSLDSIATSLNLLARSEFDRKSLVAAGLARSKTFTWERCADETLRAYELALSARSKRSVEFR